jgi:hypothetical protein
MVSDHQLAVLRMKITYLYFWRHFLAALFGGTFGRHFLAALFGSTFCWHFWWHFLVALFAGSFWWHFWWHFLVALFGRTFCCISVPFWQQFLQQFF